MGKPKVKIKRPQASRQLLVMTLAKAASTNKLLMGKIDYLRGLLKTVTQEKCGACGAAEGKHDKDCILTEELAKLEPGEATYQPGLVHGDAENEEKVRKEFVEGVTNHMREEGERP